MNDQVSENKVIENNGFYSSDEDVAWGPLTLREIKREFLKPRQRELVRKANFPKDAEKNQDLQTSGSIISSNADYHSANETLESNLKSDGEKKYEMENTLLKSKEIDDKSNIVVSSSIYSSEEKDCIDTNAIICEYSDQHDEGLKRLTNYNEETNLSNNDIISLSSDDENATSYENLDGIGVLDDEGLKRLTNYNEETNLSNNDIISLSSDDENATSYENLDGIGAAVENTFDEHSMVYDCNESILSNEISNSSNFAANNINNSALENYSSTKEYSTSGLESDDYISSSTTENKENEYKLTSLTSDDRIRTRRAPCDKSKNSISLSNNNNKIKEYVIEGITPLGFIKKHFLETGLLETSSNENKNTEHQFDNYESVLSASFSNNVEENKFDKIMSLPTFSDEKLSNSDMCGNRKYSSCELNNFNYECVIEKSESNPNLKLSKNAENILLNKSTAGLITQVESSKEKFSKIQKSRDHTVRSIDSNSSHINKFSHEESLKDPQTFVNSEVVNDILSREIEENYEFNINDDFIESKSDYSSQNESNYNEGESFLNDTLDDIENLIKNGVEINTTSDEIVHNNVENESFSHIEQPISRIPIILSASDKSKYSSQSSLGDFKMPNARNAKKNLNVDKILTPIKKSPSVFKDIISPVRMYIKNSSMPILKQSHKPIMVENTLSSISETFIIQPIKHRNLLKSFPEVIYKPSKKVIEKFDSEIILPDNIRKLVKERIVIKHEIRTKVNLNESELSTREKLQMADLSCVMSDERNMSLHTAKQGFNI